MTAPIQSNSPSSADFFEAKYADAPDNDPWRFETDRYEQSRYAALLEALPRGRYRRAYEPGCSIGALTVRLAGRCDGVVAVDCAPTAVAAAGRRYGNLGNVEFRCAMLPANLTDTDGLFDLIVLAEIGYYFSAPLLGALIKTLASRLTPGGDLVAQHWTGTSRDHVLTAAQTHRVIGVSLGWPPLLQQQHPGFVLDLWRRP